MKKPLLIGIYQLTKKPCDIIQPNKCSTDMLVVACKLGVNKQAPSKKWQYTVSQKALNVFLLTSPLSNAISSWKLMRKGNSQSTFIVEKFRDINHIPSNLVG